MAIRIQVRRGTVAEWATANPILAEGEAGLETDTAKVKYGNGVDTWASLPYATLPPDDVVAAAEDAAVAAVPGVLEATDFGPYVGPEVDAHIAADPGFTAAAEAAVDNEIVNRDLLEGGDILEETLAFAVVDEDGRRTWLEAGMDGGPTDYATGKIGAPVAMNGEITGLSFAVVDEDGRRTWIEADNAGMPTDYALAAFRDGFATSLHSGPGIVCWGDSMTAGQTGAINYPVYLAGITNLSVSNQGIAGDTSAGIAGRQGGNPYLLMPSGGTFPASGSVPVTVMTPSGTAFELTNKSFAGTVAGISGTFATDGADASTFTRATPGAAVTLTQPAPFYLDTAAERRGDIHIYWAGSNNLDPARVVGDIRAMIQRQARPDKRFLVITPIARATYAPGSPEYVAMEAIENELFNLYGRRAINYREYMVNYGLTDAGITPTATDTANIADGIVPESLRTDGIHLTAAGLQLVAAQVAARLEELEWT